jgi:precorrin-8X/cobalt-precorrin-8 methylmutase
MEKIVLVGHGSPKKDANNMDVVGKMLHEAIHPGCSEECVYTSYLQFQSPTLEDALKAALQNGTKKVIIHPYFLSAGMHVTKDIPEVIDGFKKSSPDVEFVYTDPLGVSRRLVDLVQERMIEAGGLAPQEIEDRSFEILSEDADFTGFDKSLHPIIKRVIHATADFSFLSTLTFTPDALEAGLRAIKAGKNVVTDVEMVRAGINSRILNSWGGEAICKIGQVEAVEGQTRSEINMDESIDDNTGIVVIGNAPTALYRVMERIKEGKIKPDLVVGVPVGFVRAVESKAELAAQEFPYITNAGRRGGTPVAVSIVNAILLIAGKKGEK